MNVKNCSMDFIKILIRSIIRRMVQCKFVWLLVKPFSWIGMEIWSARQRLNEVQLRMQQNHYHFELLKDVLKDMTVLHGPFKGLQYPALNSAGSVFFPKLLGSYEKELHNVIEEICIREYAQILNVGCGEGYYAIGLSKRIPAAQIFAYDVDYEARALCNKMAANNGVSENVFVYKSLSSDQLADFKFTGKALIVSDCEGYEKSLFNWKSVRNLEYCDLLIETHDFIDITISADLLKLFSKTHRINVIKSCDDIEKAKTYNFKELESLDLNTKREILREGRPAIMEWFYLQSIK